MTNNNANAFYQDTEHYLQRVLAGNADEVRRRLTLALDRLDYDFIDEGDLEIQAKRNARGWGASYASADVLDYPRTLIIKLKPLNENLTRASFVYIVSHGWLQKGEKEILTREAETLAALSTVRVTDQICAGCGAESTADSRFCRKCGLPMTSDETALEILRMSAEARSGHTSVVIGTIFGVVIAILNLAALISLIYSGAGNKGVFIFLTCGIVLSLLAVISNGFGWKRLNKALKMKDQDKRAQNSLAGQTAPMISGSENHALPPPTAYSVIENTTKLLGTEERQAVPVNRQSGEKISTNKIQPE